MQLPRHLCRAEFRTHAAARPLTPPNSLIVCLLSQATLVQGVNSVTAELEGVEKLSDQVGEADKTPRGIPTVAP